MGDKGTSAFLHPLKECVININRGRKGSLTGNIKLEILEEMSNHHPVKEIPIRDQKMFQKHKINNKLRNVNSNARRRQ